jgi:hypothetical protein
MSRSSVAFLFFNSWVKSLSSIVGVLSTGVQSTLVSVAALQKASHSFLKQELIVGIIKCIIRSSNFVSSFLITSQVSGSFTILIFSVISGDISNF